MRLAAPLLLALLLPACSSSTDLIDQRSLGCDPGQDVSIQAGLNGAREQGMGSDRLDVVVEVSNNSHDEVTVTFVRVDQGNAGEAPYRIENSYRRFDQVIPEGEDHTFELPTTGRINPQSSTRSISSSQGIEMIVTVGLSNGDSYRCVFAVPIR